MSRLSIFFIPEAVNIPQERDIPSYVDAMKSKAYSISNSLASKAKELQLENDSLSKVYLVEAGSKK